jgi:hypothetical protein
VGKNTGKKGILEGNPKRRRFKGFFLKILFLILTRAF